ncbi:hypothetical protein PRUB_a1996 [Pseudoalteromonas rubra]|uniref:Cytoplasmic protein n=1 Tax=Pseudoalteromonas rubra TaxID=43658 RepID=A0A0L0EUY0_9GAMM|nr:MULTISPECIES: DUF1249 domain-containing protein [Pseudoalteromonas]ALU44233.1 cytoplasmic protein [Pseudoalteromonas rubra]KAF7788895.1 hypothetical protein PRUB_a1996 [Pseudoalteromonas rubra]KNC68180.1 cytoplasmic protein [Pseudoalteromonas rubra]MDK1312118.1 DUF1249 domain-containing protein [Pseudoalteromonas sp. R96]
MQKEYIQSLPKYITLCERNYLRALKLLPEETVGNSRELHLGAASYHIRIDGIARYTTDIAVVQKQQISAHLDDFVLSVRLYHDAKVAEVIHHDFHQRIKPSYRYPNPDMHHKDEKYQLNAFLADWLMACLESGRIPLNWDVNNGLV